MDDSFRYIPCGVYTVIITKNENTINNENRKNIVFPLTALYRGNEFIVKGIVYNQDDTLVNITMLMYNNITYIVGQRIKAKEFDPVLEHENTEGIKYYKTLVSALMCDEAILHKIFYDGQFMNYYNNGSVYTVGNFKNGKLHGTYTNFYPYDPKTDTANEKYTCNFINGLKDGEQRDYYENRDIKSIRNYKLGILNGRSGDFWKHKRQKTVMNYVSGKLEGQYVEFYNGKHNPIKVFGTMKNNQKDGIWTYGSKSGNISKKGIYIMDKMIGLWTEYYGENIIRGKGDYKNDICCEYKEYFIDGKLKSKGMKNHDLKVGKWSDYNRMGYVWREVYYSKKGVIKNIIKLGPVG